ncbi:MAG: archaeal heat shock protein Hsp20 [Nitrososphaerales archaeon]
MAWDDWFRKRMRPFMGPWYYEMEEMMREMEKMFEQSVKELEKSVPKELVRERKLADGTTRREWGPFVYGYSVTIGPDGKPVIREFGNVKPSITSGGRFALKGEREPLIDTISSGDEVKVIAELPGVNKEQIKLSATENTLSIRTDTPERKYSKEIDLPAEVDPASAKSSYKNGMLEVTLKKRKGTEDSGVSIPVE